MALDDNETLSAAEQAQMDEMRAADAPEGSEAPAEPSSPPPAAEPGQEPAAGEGEAPAAEAPPRQQMVQLAALHEERERRKDAEHRAKVLEERTNLILQRFNQQPAAQQVADAPKAPPPLDQDPVGHIVGQQQLQGQALQQVARLLQAQEQEQKRSVEITGIQQQAVALEQEYRATTPDYDAAVAHLLASQEGELLISGFTDPVLRRKVLSEQALGTVIRSLQRGKNPAETIYELAKARGYTAAKPAAEAAPAAATDKIGQIAAGQQQRSLGQARGSGPAALNAQRLIELSDAEFLKILDTPEGRDLMGG